ncbi:MAG: PD40 domain-containing protein [Endomicrobiales bacterium]|nr:PD40 domain-containing protein [Endomicrobiales bacterium]
MFFLFSLSKGIRMMKRGNYVDAVVYFKKLVKEKKHLAESHFNLGRCYYKISNFRESKLNLHKALDCQYSPEFARSILEITNWKMLSSYEYFNNSPSFSYDGKKIVYVSARKDTNNDGRINIMDKGGIYMIDLATQAEQYVVTDEFYNSQPKYSPDGKKLAYLSIRKYLPGKDMIDQRENPSLYYLDLETGEETKLLGAEYRTKYYVFSNDSRKIIFSGWRPGKKNSGIYEMDIDTKEIKILVTDFYDNTFPSISKDGTMLLFSSWRKDTNKDGVIDIKDNSGVYIKNLIDASERMIASDKYNNIFPAFSHDNDKVIYLSYRRDTNKDGIINSLDNPGIYYYDLTRNKEYCAVNDKFFNKFPNLTPDGKKIVFLSSWRRTQKKKESEDFFENKGIYVLDINKNKVTQLVSDKYYGCYYPVVSPAGDKLVFISWRGNTNRGLFLADLKGLPSRDELHTFIDENL